MSFVSHRYRFSFLIDGIKEPSDCSFDVCHNISKCLKECRDMELLKKSMINVNMEIFWIPFPREKKKSLLVSTYGKLIKQKIWKCSVSRIYNKTCLMTFYLTYQLFIINFFVKPILILNLMHFLTKLLS